jgi:hypothetical protein
MELVSQSVSQSVTSLFSYVSRHYADHTIALVWLTLGYLTTFSYYPQSNSGANVTDELEGTWKKNTKILSRDGRRASLNSKSGLPDAVCSPAGHNSLHNCLMP